MQILYNMLSPFCPRHDFMPVEDSVWLDPGASRSHEVVSTVNPPAQLLRADQHWESRNLAKLTHRRNRRTTGLQVMTPG